jgi:hypothetical protein
MVVRWADVRVVRMVVSSGLSMVVQREHERAGLMVVVMAAL